MNVVLTIKALQKLHAKLVEIDKENANIEMCYEGDGNKPRTLFVEVRQKGERLWTEEIKLTKEEAK